MKRKIFNTVSFLYGLLMMNGGMDKFLHYMPVPESFPEAIARDNAAFGEISWLLPLVGSAELLGGLLILFPRTRALGALVLFPVMVGILLSHTFTAPEGLPIALVIWVIFLWIIYDNREKYLPVIR